MNGADDGEGKGGPHAIEHWRAAGAGAITSQVA
jgi:hypothetical protein